MGSKLAILAAQLIALGTAHADSAAELMKKGIAAYKANRFEDAAALLKKAYDLEPKPESLFALAQAERQAGHCDAAVPHYKALLAGTGDLAISKLVAESLALCPEPKKVEEPPPPPPPPPKHEEPPPAPPPPVKITVTRTVSHTDALAVTMFVTGGLALGAGAGLAIASSDLASAADHAATLDQFSSQHDRADRDRTLGIIAGGLGVALVGVGVWRLVSHGDPPGADVAIAPTTGGAALSFAGRW